MNKLVRTVPIIVLLGTLAFVFAACASPAAPTVAPVTNAPVPSTVPATNTPNPTSAPATATSLPATATQLLATATSAPTSAPATATNAPTTAAQVKQVAVTSRDADVTIESNGDVSFAETWVVNFTGGPFSYAFRSIPIQGATSGYYKLGVSENGEAYKGDKSSAPNSFELQDTSRGSKITWHFSPTTDATRTFLLNYTAHNAIVPNISGSDLEWTIIEPDRDYTIGPSKVTVHLPETVDPSEIKASSKPSNAGLQARVVDGSTVEFLAGPFAPGSDWTIHVLVPAKRAAQRYDGDWQGDNSSGTPFGFIVKNNQVVYLNVNYSYRVGDCSGGKGTGYPVENAPIKDDGFTATYTGSDNRVYTVVGKFTSPTHASGTQEVKGSVNLGSCKGEIDAKDSWTAINATVARTPTPRPPTPTPTGNASPPKKPNDLVLSFFFAVDFQQVDAAVTLLADDNVKYAFGATGGTGKASLKAYLDEQVKQGVQYKFVNGQITVKDALASFPLQATGGQPKTYNCDATVVDGKITNLTCK